MDDPERTILILTTGRLGGFFLRVYLDLERTILRKKSKVDDPDKKDDLEPKMDDLEPARNVDDIEPN